MNRRAPKKSESLEIRVSHELKDRLQRAAEAQSISTSALLRTIVEAYLNSPDYALSAPGLRAGLIRYWKTGLLILLASLLCLSTVWAVMESDYFSETAREFRRLDYNSDQLLSRPELELGFGPDWQERLDFDTADMDGDNMLTRPEFDSWHIRRQFEQFRGLVREQGRVSD